MMVFGLNVLRKGRCEVCGVTTSKCLPEFDRRDGVPVSICTGCVADLLDYVIQLRKTSSTVGNKP
jgi:hypothetical protein